MTDIVTTSAMMVEQWPLGRLKAHPLNPRGAVDPASVRELAQSLAEVGMLSPIIVTSAGLIVAGHRRFAAAQLARLEAVPVTVRDLAPSEQLIVMLVENLQRADLSPLAEARALKGLLDEGLTVADLVRRTGVGRRRIEGSLALLKLDSITAGLADRGDLPSGAIPLLARVDDVEKRQALAGEVAAYRMTLQGLRLAVGLVANSGERKAARMSQPSYVAAAEKSTPSSGRACGLECRDRLERLTAALAALARAEATIRRELGDGYVPHRPQIISEVRNVS